MTRDHGTRARYVCGPDVHGRVGRGCRCTPCTQANRQAEDHRARMKLYGQWRPYVDAAPAREHLRVLAAAGIGWRRAAELAGVATGAVSKLLYGGPGDRPPSRGIRPETEQQAPGRQGGAGIPQRGSADGRGRYPAPGAGTCRRRLLAGDPRRAARRPAVQLPPGYLRSGDGRHRAGRPRALRRTVGQAAGRERPPAEDLRQPGPELRPRPGLGAAAGLGRRRDRRPGREAGGRLAAQRARALGRRHPRPRLEHHPEHRPVRHGSPDLP